jgi:hypothetical protein
MDKILFQFRHPGSEPTLETLYEEYGFEPGEIDLDYGIVKIDSAESLYAVLVDAAAQERVQARLPSDAEQRNIGFFANTRIEPIEPFGPPEP